MTPRNPFPSLCTYDPSVPITPHSPSPFSVTDTVLGSGAYATHGLLHNTTWIFFFVCKLSLPCKLSSPRKLSSPPCDRVGTRRPPCGTTYEMNSLWERELARGLAAAKRQRASEVGRDRRGSLSQTPPDRFPWTSLLTLMHARGRAVKHLVQ
jgi:hypothetical protein